MDSLAEMDSRLMERIQMVREFAQKESIREGPLISEEEKLRLMIEKNREALNTQNLIYNEAPVEINESVDDVMPKSKPP